MTIFITIAIFLCISYILYCELRTLESIVYWGVLIAALWGLLHFQTPLQWWMIGNFSVSFWDLSIGLLALTSVFCLFRHIWVETTMMRKELWNLVESFGAYIKDVWQDKLIIKRLWNFAESLSVYINVWQDKLIRKKLWNLVEPLGAYINDVWQDKLFAFTLIAILVFYVASIISFITK